MREKPLYLELVPLAEAAAAAHHALRENVVRRQSLDRIAEIRRETVLALGALATVYSRSEQRPLAFAEVEARVAADLADLYIRRSELLRCIETLQSGRGLRSTASDLRAESRRLKQWTSDVVATAKDTMERAKETMRRSQALHERPSRASGSGQESSER